MARPARRAISELLPEDVATAIVAMIHREWAPQVDEA
jgi:hypothetical protein